eukprot:TRINITY_DN8966_c0_g2_i9.p1 TRINITY_DN8966_c0_g2~~TRINITY_DN8966_c0_g2_i9.p1  ORF type:complete len:245 (+),score=59.12 TRINITY_DN8966_c0_g2_i9:84-818(+)
MEIALTEAAHSKLDTETSPPVAHSTRTITLTVLLPDQSLQVTVPGSANGRELKAAIATLVPDITPLRQKCTFSEIEIGDEVPLVSLGVVEGAVINVGVSVCFGLEFQDLEIDNPDGQVAPQLPTESAVPLEWREAQGLPPGLRMDRSGIITGNSGVGGVYPCRVVAHGHAWEEIVPFVLRVVPPKVIEILYQSVTARSVEDEDEQVTVDITQEPQVIAKGWGESWILCPESMVQQTSRDAIGIG